MPTLTDKAKRVRLLVLDVDGVMTDGTLYLDDRGEEIKGFNSLDGHGLKMLRQSGVMLAILTGRTSKLVEHRAMNLGITLVRQGVEDKLEGFVQLLSDLGLEAAESAYMGDDVVDLPAMRRCGLAISVPNAHELVHRYAHYVTRAQGGRGAVREACELIMRAQGTLDAQLARFLT